MSFYKYANDNIPNNIRSSNQWVILVESLNAFLYLCALKIPKSLQQSLNRLLLHTLKSRNFLSALHSLYFHTLWTASVRIRCL